MVHAQLITVLVAAAPCDQNEFPRAELERPMVLPMCALELTQRVSIAPGLGFDTDLIVQGVSEVRGSPAPELQLRARVFETFFPLYPPTRFSFGVARSLGHRGAVEVQGTWSPSATGISFGVPLRLKVLPWLGLTGLESVVSLSWSSNPRAQKYTMTELSIPIGVLLKPSDAWSIELKARTVLFIFVLPELRAEGEATLRVATNRRLDLFSSVSATIYPGSASPAVGRLSLVAGVSVRFFPR